MVKRRKQLSTIMVFHYVKLCFRSALFLGALLMYILGRMNGIERPLSEVRHWPVFLTVIWFVFVLEMILRSIPSRVESMGCQKQFRLNYIPPENFAGKPQLQHWSVTAAVTGVWVALNGILGVLFYIGIFDAGIMLLIALAYSVCDMICILFFCPFQTWFMKNKCCGTCRIYNWDYAMMFTPLIFVRGFYCWSLVLFSLVILVRWEVTYHKHPERFAENANCSLKCQNCREKLCHHKTQIRQFIRKTNTEHM